MDGRSGGREAARFLMPAIARFEPPRGKIPLAAGNGKLSTSSLRLTRVSRSCFPRGSHFSLPRAQQGFKSVRKIGRSQADVLNFEAAPSLL